MRAHFNWLKHCMKWEDEIINVFTYCCFPSCISLTFCWILSLAFTFFPNPSSRGQHYSPVQPDASLWKKTPYGFFCCLSGRLFQDTSLALGTGPAVRGPVYLGGISGFPSHPSYGRPWILALSQADLFRGKLILLQKANAKINPRLLGSGEVAGKRSLCKCMFLIPCYNRPPLTSITGCSKLRTTSPAEQCPVGESAQL